MGASAIANLYVFTLGGTGFIVFLFLFYRIVSCIWSLEARQQFDDARRGMLVVLLFSLILCSLAVLYYMK